MFERFTEAARQVVVLAHDEARALRHNYIGIEHLLLGPAAQSVHQPSPSEFYGSHGRVLLPRMPSASKLPRRSATYGERVRPELSLLAGWVLFGTALGIGVLAGWAIWA